MKLIDVVQLTDEKFLNLFKLVYEHEGKIINWTISSRNKKEDLVCMLKNKKADTVCIVPRINVDGKEYLVFTKEFRQPTNGYVYSFPAGVVEQGEDPLLCAKRELKEEIGAEEISEVNQLTDVCFNSEGMTDESVIVYEVVVTKLGKQDLQDHEDINMFFVPIEELGEFMKDKPFNSKVAMYCAQEIKNFELKKQIEELKNKALQ